MSRCAECKAFKSISERVFKVLNQTKSVRRPFILAGTKGIEGPCLVVAERIAERTIRSAAIMRLCTRCWTRAGCGNSGSIMA